jgi:hypothetical protein
VRYEVADLLDLPAAWDRAFDLVVEVYSVQALPVAVRAQVTASVAGLVADGGTLFVVAGVRDAVEPGSGPPWPLTRDEVRLFAAGLETVRIERRSDRWVAEFRRP